MPPAPPQQGQGQDNHMAAMWISFGAFAVLIILWFVFKVYIVQAFFFVKSFEISIISLFTNKFQSMQQWMQTIDPEKVTPAELGQIANRVGTFFLIPMSILMVVLGVLLLNRSVGSRFKTVYNMDNLLKQEVKVWPQTMPVLGLDLLSEDLDKGPWAMAKTPMDFAKEHQLIKLHRKAIEEGMLSKSATLQATLIKTKANQLFVKQLGAIWQGVDRLPMHTKALFVIIGARIANEPGMSREVVEQIAKSANTGKLNFSKINELAVKYCENKIVKKTIQRHAYILTVLAAMLEVARATGVLASADFLWLKIIDRRLWFMLNAVGRQTPTTEVAGPYAHWKYEKALDRAFRTPMIEEATKALELALKEQVYKEGEE